MCSGRPFLIHLWKKQSGSPLVIFQHSTSTTRTEKISFGYRIIQLQPTLTLDIPLPQHISFGSIAWHLPSFDWKVTLVVTRYDLYPFECKWKRFCVTIDDSEIGTVNAGGKGPWRSSFMYIMLYEEEAVNHIHGMVNELIKELNWELLKPYSNVPMSSKKRSFDITRAIHHGYKYRDGYSITTNEMKNLVMITVLEPVPI